MTHEPLNAAKRAFVGAIVRLRDAVDVARDHLGRSSPLRGMFLDEHARIPIPVQHTEQPRARGTCDGGGR